VSRLYQPTEQLIFAALKTATSFSASLLLRCQHCLHDRRYCHRRASLPGQLHFHLQFRQVPFEILHTLT
jgi:hypothetical protein